MNQNEKLKVVFIELLDSLSNCIAEFLFDRTGWTAVKDSMIFLGFL